MVTHCAGTGAGTGMGRRAKTYRLVLALMLVGLASLLFAGPAAREAMATPASSNQTLYLTVPKMGLYHAPVANTADPAALDQGAVKLPRSGFPWQPGANTYIVGHVLGYAGTGSYLQFAKLPQMRAGDLIYLENAYGTTYTYRVSEKMVVSPYATWVSAPVPGRTMVTLQTCVNPPAYDQRLVVRANLVGIS